MACMLTSERTHESDLMKPKLPLMLSMWPCSFVPTGMKLYASPF